MLKNVVRSTGPQGLRFSIQTLLGWLSDSSLAGLETKHAELFTKITRILGRPPTEHEMRFGVPKPEPSQEQIAESRRAKVRADHNRRMEAEANFSPEAERLRVARERAEAERVAGLSPVARELELAETAAKEAEHRKADKAKRAEIKETPAYKSLREALDSNLLITKLDESISQEAVDAITSQIEQLERTADVPAIRANLATIQKAIAEKVAIQDAQLQEAIDRSELRKRLLASGSIFDSVDVELVGSLPFVVLQSGGKTMKVTQERYDSRSSDEALRTELFGESEVTNV